MSFEEIVIVLMIVFGTALGSMLLWKIFHTVKSSIDRNKGSISEEDYDRLAYAFVQQKKEMK